MNSKIVQILEERGISRYKLSKMTGIPTSTLHGWVNGESTPNAEKLALVADALNVSIEFFLDKEDKKKPQLPQQSELDEKIFNLMKCLDDNQKAKAADYLELLLKARSDN